MEQKDTVKRLISIEKRLEALEKIINNDTKITVTKKMHSADTNIIKKTPGMATKGNTKKVTIKSGRVELAKYKNGIILTGDTYDKKDTIKKYKGWWTPTMKGWTVKLEYYDKIKKEFLRTCQTLSEKNVDKLLEHIETVRPLNNLNKQTNIDGFLSDSD